MGASGYSVVLVLKVKQGNLTRDNVGGQDSNIYYWSKFPMELVPTPSLKDKYTARPIIPLQMTTNREQQRLSMSNLMRCEPRISIPYKLWFGFNVILAHSSYRRQLLKNS